MMLSSHHNLSLTRQRSSWGIAALVAAVSVGLVTLLFPHWYTASPYLIDPWVYWGTAYALDDSASAFSTTYYFRRWTLVLPQHFASQFLSPLSTQVVVQGLTFPLTVLLPLGWHGVELGKPIQLVDGVQTWISPRLIRCSPESFRRSS